MALLELMDVWVHYGSVAAVRGVSLAVNEGEIVTLLGANGAGKTTTLKSIVGLVPPSRGVIALDGIGIIALSTESVVKRGVTLVPEGRRVFSTLTVAENLRLGAASLPYAEYEATLEEVFDLFPVLTTKLGLQAGLLSGGEQQQLAIARALMSRPRLLLLDEPSLGLAPRLVAAVFQLIAELRERGVTILLVEQNVDRALELADRAYILATGEVELSGPTTALAAREIEDSYLGITRAAAGER